MHFTCENVKKFVLKKKRNEWKNFSFKENLSSSIHLSGQLTLFVVSNKIAINKIKWTLYTHREKKEKQKTIIQQHHHPNHIFFGFLLRFKSSLYFYPANWIEQNDVMWSSLSSIAQYCVHTSPTCIAQNKDRKQVSKKWMG